MRVYGFNRFSKEGRRLHELYHKKFNAGRASEESTVFSEQDVPTMVVGSINRAELLFHDSYTLGVKRPEIRIRGQIQDAWSDFNDRIKQLTFEDGEELPFTYVQSLDDETIKTLIDGGLYSDPHFERLFNKLMHDEVFDVNDLSLHVSMLDINDEKGRPVPVVLVEPTHVIESEHGSVHSPSLQEVIRAQAELVPRLRREGLDKDLLDDYTIEDEEVFLDDIDTLDLESSEETTPSSTVLTEDEEVDLTADLKNAVTFEDTDEDLQIRALKQDRESRRGTSVLDFLEDESILSSDEQVPEDDGVSSAAEEEVTVDKVANFLDDEDEDDFEL